MNISSLVNPLQASLGSPFKRFGSLPTTPGFKIDQALNVQVISRKWRPSPKPAATDNVVIINGLYRLDGTGDFVSPGAQWGTARYIETLVMSDSDEYAKDTEATQIIAGIEYIFTATTINSTTVTAFSFTDVIGAELSTLTESAAITILGITIPVSFTVTGGEAEKNDSGTWTTSGTVVVNDTVKLRRMSSADYEDPLDVVFNANGTSDTWTLTTRPDITLYWQDGQIFFSYPNTYIDGGLYEL